MKKNDLVLIALAAVYVVLFNVSACGVNHLVFSIIEIFAILLLNPTSLYKQKFWLIAVSLLLTGVASFYYGTILPLVANSIAAILLPTVAFQASNSLFVNFFNSFYALIASPIVVLINSFTPKDNEATKASFNIKKVVLFFLALGVSLFFLGFYCFSNPLLVSFIEKINFDFFSWQMVYYFMIGLWFSYLIVYPIYNKYIGDRDLAAPNLLTENNQSLRSFMERFISLENEAFLGLMLFGLVNLFLLLSNGLDCYYLFVKKAMPSDVTFSEYVHGGAYSVVISIFFATLVVLFFFRNQINFLLENKAIKTVALLWIIQNIATVLFAMNRAYWYIQTYGMTYKRIGLLFYLFLCMVGLATVFIKIISPKTNWYLFRVNFIVVYTTLIFSSFFDWDVIITRFNLTNFQNEKTMAIDEKFLVDLSYTNLPLLYQFYVIENKNLVWQYNNDFFDFDSSSSNFRSYSKEDMSSLVQEKYKALQQQLKNGKWQSYCYSKHSVANEIHQLIENKKNGK